jgi:hypothetical protein
MAGCRPLKSFKVAFLRINWYYLSAREQPVVCRLTVNFIFLFRGAFEAASEPRGDRSHGTALAFA